MRKKHEKIVIIFASLFELSSSAFNSILWCGKTAGHNKWNHQILQIILDFLYHWLNIKNNAEIPFINKAKNNI